MIGERAEDCGSVGKSGPCCKPRGHTGVHARPLLAWDEWGGICGVICPCGPNGEPLACGWLPGHDGTHSWGSLPTAPTQAAS